MSEQPGELIGSGRAADVYDLGDGTVLRRYRSDHPWLEREAEVMRLVRASGFPVPQVYAVDGRDLVMDRVEGPSMMDWVQQRPARLWSAGALLAKLQATLAEIPAPAWMLAGGSPPSGSERVLHLDMHPMNVIMSARGPVVIDWTNASGGPPGFDAAMTYVEIAAYPVDDPKWRVGREILVRRFRRTRGRRLVDPFVVAACDHRLADVNTTPEERVALADLRRARRAS